MRTRRTGGAELSAPPAERRRRAASVRHGGRRVAVLHAARSARSLRSAGVGERAVPGGGGGARERLRGGSRRGGEAVVDGGAGAAAPAAVVARGRVLVLRDRVCEPLEHLRLMPRGRLRHVLELVALALDAHVAQRRRRLVRDDAAVGQSSRRGSPARATATAGAGASGLCLLAWRGGLRLRDGHLGARLAEPAGHVGVRLLVPADPRVLEQLLVLGPVAVVLRQAAQATRQKSTELVVVAVRSPAEEMQNTCTFQTSRGLLSFHSALHVITLIRGGLRPLPYTH